MVESEELLIHEDTNDNTEKSRNEGKKEYKYNIYGRTPDMEAKKIELRNVSLTEDQLADILHVSYKQLQMDSKTNLSYVTSFLRNRGSYNEAVKRVEAMLEDLQNDARRNEYTGKYDQEWQKFIVNSVDDKEGPIYNLLKDAAENRKNLQEIVKQRIKLEKNIAEVSIREYKAYNERYELIEKSENGILDTESNVYKKYQALS